MFIWLIYLGISYGCKLRKHIKIDAALHLFPKKIQKYVVIIGDIFFFLFALYIVVTGFNYCVAQAAVGKASSALGIPFQYVYSATVVGFGSCCIPRGTDHHLQNQMYQKRRGV